MIQIKIAFSFVCIVPVAGINQNRGLFDSSRRKLQGNCIFNERMIGGNTLYRGECVCGNDCELCLQEDGMLIIDGGSIIGNKKCHHAAMQGDGNFVCYPDKDDALWASTTADYPGSYLEVKNCHVEIIYDGKTVKEYYGDAEILSMPDCVFNKRMEPGSTLKRGDCVCGSKCKLCLQDNGMLVIDGGSIAGNRKCDHVSMQGDGNFVCYGNDVGLWHSDTRNYLGAYLEVKDCHVEIISDGNTVKEFYGDSDVIIKPACMFDDRMEPGSTLKRGDCVCGNDCDLCLQDDGMLIIDSGSIAGNKKCDRASMQGNGNFVCYVNNDSLWSTNTANYPGAYLKVKDCHADIIHDGKTLKEYYGDIDIVNRPDCMFNERMVAGNTIYRGDCVCGSECKLCLEYEGTLEIGGTSIAGRRMCNYVSMQGDGNFVCYQGTDDGDVQWASNTVDQPGSYVKVEDCCVQIIYNGKKTREYCE